MYLTRGFKKKYGRVSILSSSVGLHFVYDLSLRHQPVCCQFRHPNFNKYPPHICISGAIWARGAWSQSGTNHGFLVHWLSSLEVTRTGHQWWTSVVATPIKFGLLHSHQMESGEPQALPIGPFGYGMSQVAPPLFKARSKLLHNKTIHIWDIGTG